MTCVESRSVNWIERLNRLPGRVALGGEVAVTVSHWAYAAHLSDNIPHRHTYFEVCLVGGYGGGAFRVEGTPHVIYPGDLFIARPGVLHQIINAQPELMELYWVSFQPEFRQREKDSGANIEENSIAALLRRFADASAVLTLPDEDDSLGQLWRVLRTVAAQSDAGPGQDARLQSLAAALLLGILQKGAGLETPLPDSGRPSDAGAILARAAVRYIHDNLSAPLRLPTVAARLNISSRHLSRLLEKFTGVSPAVYIEMARMDRARALLLRTDDPIKQVAALVGYADIHHFTRVFTRRVGCPPGVYRRTEGGADPTPRGPKIQIPGSLV